MITVSLVNDTLYIKALKPVLPHKDTGMIIKVNQKSIGKNKRIKTVPLEYATVPSNVYELIEETVRIMVNDFIRRAENKITPLSDEQR